jgi:hypothetical protein
MPGAAALHAAPVLGLLSSDVRTTSSLPAQGLAPRQRPPTGLHLASVKGCASASLLHHGLSRKPYAAPRAEKRLRRACVRCRAQSDAALEWQTPPHAAADVDSELWAVLDLCSDDELEEVHSILFGASQAACMHLLSVMCTVMPEWVQGRRVQGRLRFSELLG